MIDEERLRDLSDSRLPDLKPLYHRYLQPQAEQLRDAYEHYCLTRPITLYDQFGRPVYAPSGKKIGDTITVRRPTRFKGV